MPRGKSLSDVEKGKTLALNGENDSVTEISRKIERSRRVVAKFLKDQVNYGSCKRSGRKRKLNTREERIIARAASNSCVSCSKLTALLPTKVSKTTVWRALRRNSNLCRSKMNCAPRLLDRHKVARLEFALNNMDTDWTSVIFSDEKKWNLDGPDGLNGYWRDLRKERQFFDRRDFGGGSVMMWGTFSSVGCLEMRFTSSKMNSRDYVQVLRSSLIPFLVDNPEKTWIFQQDNARIHTSRERTHWLELNSVNLMQWPQVLLMSTP